MAATLAQLHSFMSTLPDGYNTIIGEQGVRLSGGQGQRLAVARALLQDAPILLLDEATSQLDGGTERRLMAAIRARRRGRTTLIIAHRLTTITKADQIVVLAKGQVVEQGTHADLRARGGEYARLWQEQTIPSRPLPELASTPEPVQISPRPLIATNPPWALDRGCGRWRGRIDGDGAGGFAQCVDHCQQYWPVDYFSLFNFCGRASPLHCHPEFGDCGYAFSVSAGRYGVI